MERKLMGLVLGLLTVLQLLGGLVVMERMKNHATRIKYLEAYIINHQAWCAGSEQWEHDE